MYKVILEVILERIRKFLKAFFKICNYSLTAFFLLVISELFIKQSVGFEIELLAFQSKKIEGNY